jgi:hypothetical protein
MLVLGSSDKNLFNAGTKSLSGKMAFNNLGGVD